MKHKKKLLSGFMAMSMALSIVPVSDLLSLSDITVVRAADQQQTGKTPDGYDYELWNQYGQGNVNMDLGSNGGFSCSWSGIENCLFRTGKKLGSTKKYQDYGKIQINYDVDYEPKGNSYMCVYGWTEDPTVEYYIVEAWGDWRPPGMNNSKGTVSSDGKKYDIYTSTRVNQPSIHGMETFEQYWSVNQTNPAKVYSMTNLKGTITVSDHFKAWEQAGMKMGLMYEVALNIEGYKSSGSANVKKNELIMGGSDNGGNTGGNDTPVTPPASNEKDPSGTAPGAGTGVSTDCETSAGGWTARGEGVKLILTGDQKNGGSKSLAVTGRTASWNGIQNASSDLKAGGLYSIESYVTYDASYDSAGFTVGLQYDQDGTTHYDDIDSVTTSAGKWAKLGNAFTVPSGATNISLYIQTKYSENDTAADLINFYVDDIKLTDSMGNTGDTGDSGNTSGTTGGSVSDGSLMAEAKKNFTSTVPADVKTGDKGTTEKITYFSKKAQKNKPANVWLPPNYSKSKKYPVVYMNHGVMGSENDLLSGWSIREMASNLIEKGEVQPFIIVFTQMYTNPAADRPSGINQDDMDRYDDFLYDLTESLMPYMAENYSAAEGRENTAIAGFSMGGRESLYIGMMACDKIGYVCASSPAPGIVPAQDMFLNHRGSMTEAEFGFKTAPYLLMIGGGTNDSVVGTFPKQYSELYTKKGQDHIWFEVQGGGHDASVGTPLFYNFFRNLFKTGSTQEPAVTTVTTVTEPIPAETTLTTTEKPSVTQPPATEIVAGDADGNGAVTVADVVKLMQHLIGKVTLSGDNAKAADMNGDGKISILDLIKLKNKLL